MTKLTGRGTKGVGHLTKWWLETTAFGPLFAVGFLVVGLMIDVCVVPFPINDTETLQIHVIHNTETFIIFAHTPTYPRTHTHAPKQPITHPPARPFTHIKWSLFHSRHFQTRVLELKYINCDWDFTEGCPKGPTNNILASVQIMAWRRPGDKPLSDPMMVSLLTHICVTLPHWVKKTVIRSRKRMISFEDFRRNIKDWANLIVTIKRHP